MNPYSAPGTRGGEKERSENPAEDFRSRERQDVGKGAPGLPRLPAHAPLLLWTSDAVSPSHQERRCLSSFPLPGPSVQLRGLCVTGCLVQPGSVIVPWVRLSNRKASLHLPVKSFECLSTGRLEGAWVSHHHYFMASVEALKLPVTFYFFC